MGEEERKEPEMSNYTKSAEIAGKLLEQMEEAGCSVPSVTLFADGSGCFIVHKKDEEVVYEILHFRLPKTHFYQHDLSDSGEAQFDFSLTDLEKYTSICSTCKRPLEKEEK